ncbi:hypothetical protein O988_06755 [Pseudogymnoascus sp. VKM F-3808]|nr:hypothetical protein O988_06755 [Pseudogymnoascus sp. VKM F-3808]
MAEAIAGLAVATSIFQVIDTTCKVVATVWKCYESIKTPPKELAQVMSEVLSFQGVLKTLHSHLSISHINGSKDLLALEMLNQLDGVLPACEVVLQDILHIIEGLEKKKLSSIIAAATGSQKLLGTIGRIERLKSLLMLALSSDHIKLSRAIEENIHLAFGELQHGQEKIHSEILDIDNHITKLSITSDKIASSQKEKQEADRYHKTLHWLSTVDFEVNHVNACRLQQPGTGLWLIEGKDFSEWARKDNSTFWLHAIPGAGKTILCSTVIQELQSRSQPTVDKLDNATTSIVVYFYFDFRNSEQQHTEGMLCSLLSQLANKLTEIPEEIRALWKKYKDNKTRPSPDELLEILTLVIQKYFNKVYVALDALDECIERQVLLPILCQFIDSECASTFLTSRREYDIHKSLSKKYIYSAAIEGSDVALDVELFVDKQIKAIESLRDLNVDLQNEIVQALVAGAKGMFRWVVCQLDALKPLGRPKAIRNALKSLPKTLDESYDRILIGIQSEEEKEFIRRALQLIIFATRPMTMEEIAEAVVIEDDSTALDPDDRFHTPEHPVKNIRSLLTTTGGYLGLSHYSVQEYLQSPRISKGPASYFAMAKSDADEEISRKCLTYLAYDDFSVGSCKSEPDLARRHVDYPFLDYAANNWFIHGCEERVQRSVAHLFDKIWMNRSPKYLSWYEAFCDSMGDRDILLSLRTYPPIVYYPALWGLDVLLERLLIGGADVNMLGGYYGQALQAAAIKQNLQCFKLLLDHGADVNAKGGYFGSAIQASTSIGCEDMVKALVERNCSLDTDEGIYDSPLIAASSGGHTGTVLILLEAGVNINARGRTIVSALHAADSNGHYLTCDALINKGAQVNAKWGNPVSALYKASAHGQTRVVKLLLERGAYVNARGGTFGTSLLAACSNGDEEIARLLLIHGADIHCEGVGDREQSTGTPLQAAASGGFTRIVSLLIQHGVNVNQQCGRLSTALHAAAQNGHERIVETLLRVDADVNREGGYYGSALQGACDYGSINVVKILLDHGADPNAQSGFFGNPLQAAATWNHVEIVRLLLERGANINAVGGSYHTALHAAAHEGNENIVEMLLEAGANVGIVGGEFGSALDAATSTGYTNVVDRLRKAEREREFLGMMSELALTDITCSPRRRWSWL